MNQVGDTRIFSVKPPLPPEGSVYSYVWEWWDGSSDATTVPWIRKTLNQGGDPFAGTGTQNLLYTCTAVGANGQSAVIPGTIQVNNPPIFLPPVVITANDQVFPYDTTIKVRAIEIDLNESLIFEWSEGGVVLGSGTTTRTGFVSYTWTGNGEILEGAYTPNDNTFTLTGVNGRRVLDLKVSDQNQGTSYYQVELRGFPAPPAVLGGGGAGISAAGQTTSLVRVGPGAQAAFELYARPPAGGSVGFSWNFAGSHQWTTTAGPVPGLVTGTSDGGYKSVYSKSLAGELFPEGSHKTVVGVATVAWTGGHTEVLVPLTLVANTAPPGITFTAKVNGEDYAWASGVPVEPGSVIEFRAVANDPELDLVTYEWNFIQPQGAVPPLSLRLWGARVVLDTAGWPHGARIQATVVARDRFQASVTEVTPYIPVTPTPAPAPSA